MEHKEFKQTIRHLTEKLCLGNKENLQSHTRLLESIETLYLQFINTLINQLNVSKKNEKQELLKQIKEADKLYLEARGISVNGQVLFSRHGQCASWGQKKFGLSPNSPISEDAERNMADTSESTKVLLSSPDEIPRIAISPMIRAMQTASLIIPKDLKANVSIESSLSENSSAPSGLDVRSNSDLQETSKKTPFFSIKRILFFLTNLFYGQKVFEALDKKRQEAAHKIQLHNNSGHDIRKDGKIPQALDYEGDKIQDTKKMINETKEKDLWLIGHGKNFKAFFEDTFGIDAGFKFGETRVVYKIEAEGLSSTLYTPPYSLVVNQQTGGIEGKYTGVSKAATKDVVKDGVVHMELQEESHGEDSTSLVIKNLGPRNVNNTGPTHDKQDKVEPPKTTELETDAPTTSQSFGRRP